jgi:putative two-component system response regulator
VAVSDDLKTNTAKIKILVIDDDLNFLFGISRTLLKSDYNVNSASNGLDGIQKAQADPPDLILLDVNMPKMTGFQVKMILNRLPVTQLIPVVFLTALNERAEILNGLNLADDYITKPLDVDILLARLNAILRRVTIGYRQAVRETNNLSFTTEKLQTWGQSVEMYDSGTAGHTMRVTRWAVSLARSLGLTGNDLENIRKGAMLHDIGKLAIPDFILNKPGPLNQDEWKIMREHATFGFEMLSPIESLRPVLDIPHYHHERWDGLGYPAKLSGEEIPLFARIFSLVDVYDALLSKRSYKLALKVSEVKEMIRTERGKHFDPNITDHFLTNFDYLQEEVANEYSQDNPGY